MNLKNSKKIASSAVSSGCNPFEQIQSKSVHNPIVGKRVKGAQIKSDNVRRTNANRHAELLAQIRGRGKKGSFEDKRIGQANLKEGAQRIMADAKKFERERKRLSKKGVGTQSSAENFQLTHYGTTLNEIADSKLQAYMSDSDVDIDVQDLIEKRSKEEPNKSKKVQLS
jgi:hypothetical protein